MDGRGNRLGWIAVALAAIALVVAVGNRAAPQIAVSVPPYAAARNAEQAAALNAQAQAERLRAELRGHDEGWRGDDRGEWRGAHHGPWGAWAFFWPLRLLLAIGLIIAGLRLLRRSRRGGPPSSGPYPGPISQL